jgi:hypothetical protein
MKTSNLTHELYFIQHTNYRISKVLMVIHIVFSVCITLLLHMRTKRRGRTVNTPASY